MMQRVPATILSSPATLNDAKAWINVAAGNVGLLSGRAPAGTFGGLVDRVGIDREIPGQSTTGKIADAALKNAQAKNPYI
jgi:hypothetical protein